MGVSMEDRTKRWTATRTNFRAAISLCQARQQQRLRLWIMPWSPGLGHWRGSTTLPAAHLQPAIRCGLPKFRPEFRRSAAKLHHFNRALVKLENAGYGVLVTVERNRPAELQQVLGLLHRPLNFEAIIRRFRSEEVRDFLKWQFMRDDAVNLRAKVSNDLKRSWDVVVQRM